jgi:hypothetical protein
LGRPTEGSNVAVDGYMPMKVGGVVFVWWRAVVVWWRATAASGTADGRERYGRTPTTMT